MKKLELRLEITETLPKINYSPNECQDSLSANLELGRFAVADGVTQSFYPAEWSNLLVEQFCQDTSKSNLDLFKLKNWQDWLLPVQGKWSALIRDKVSKKTGTDSIHLKNSLIARDPAASTFAGLQVDIHAANPTWQAMIIGDSCFFYFTNGGFKPYLVKHSSDFNYHPQYFSSIPSSRKDEPSFLSGNLEDGDVLVLATDALAKWLLIQRERNGANWDKTIKTLMSLKSSQELFVFVSNARNNIEFPMEDDDVALIILSCVCTIETFEEPTPKTPVLAEKQPQPAIKVPSAQAITPHYTPPPAPIKPTRSETIRSRKGENNSKKPPSSKSALPMLAIIIALISLLVSIYTLFLFWNHQGNVIVPTVQVMSMPTRFRPTKNTLPANIPIYLYQDDKSQIILTTQDNIFVMFLEQNKGWYKVEIELWLFSNNADTAGFVVQDTLITTQTTVPAYSAVSISPVAVGVFSPNVALQKTNESSDTSGMWYQVKFQGYVLGR